MNKVPFHNKTNKTVHVGTVSISPYGTRDVDPTHLPDAGKKPEQTVEQSVSATIDELLGLSVSDLTARLPSLSTADIDALEEAENGKEKPRTSALNAIASERVSRASQSVGGDKEADEFAQLVSTMSDEELNAQDYPEDSVFFAIVDAEKHGRELAEFNAGLDALTKDDLIAAQELYNDQPEHLALVEQKLASLDAE